MSDNYHEVKAYPQAYEWECPDCGEWNLIPEGNLIDTSEIRECEGCDATARVIEVWT